MLNSSKPFIKKKNIGFPFIACMRDKAELLVKIDWATYVGDMFHVDAKDG